MDIYELIAVSVKQNASDLHLSAANLPMLRIDGKLIRCADEALTAEALERQLLQTLTEAQKLHFSTVHQLDYSLNVDGCRLRGNLFRQRQGIAAAFRRIPQHIPSLQSLAPPSGFEKLSAVENGLILFTGPTGCGKSTTLAALLQHISQSDERHIVTLEDPIEFIHSSGRSLIQQREVGIHVDSFQQGLHAALRQDPDVILLGELRDLPTISLALTAAETGHLVLASLHTRSVVQSVERIIDVFPAQDKPYVRHQLAGALRAVVNQILLPRRPSGRIAAFELLINTSAVANLIREGKVHQIESLIQTGTNTGMQTMAQAIERHRLAGLV